MRIYSFWSVDPKQAKCYTWNGTDFEEDASSSAISESANRFKSASVAAATALALRCEAHCHAHRANWAMHGLTAAHHVALHSVLLPHLPCPLPPLTASSGTETVSEEEYTAFKTELCASLDTAGETIADDLLAGGAAARKAFAVTTMSCLGATDTLFDTLSPVVNPKGNTDVERVAK